MKTILSVRILSGFLFLSAILTMNACKKHTALPKRPTDTTATRLSNEDSLKFYVWYYMESDSANVPQYLWYNQVPTNFNPFSPIFANADSVLNGQQGLTSYPMLNGQKVDRYSFLDRTGAVSSQIQGGKLGDKGFDVRWAINPKNNSTSLFVIWAYASGPAGQAGVQRGWQIVAINGNTHVGYDGPGYLDGTGANVKMVINAIYGNSPATIKFARHGILDTIITISNAQYSFNPILFDTVFTLDGTNVGYMVYNSFVSVYNYDNKGNATPTPAKAQIDNVFNKFQAAGIKDLIIDERYNGGGAVNTAEYLDNLIAPASETGQTMYTYFFNTPLENYYKSTNTNLSVPFQKQGSLALNHVFFIVSHGTVSAAELTINNLKPVMDVKLIGSRTYGKPVGFIPQSIYIVNDTTKQEYHVADLYAIDFQTKNQAGSGDYFNGITPDKQESDYVDLNWGNPRDSSLIEAFSYIKNGTWARVYHNMRLVNQTSLRSAPSSLNKEIIEHRFNGMVDQRLNIRIPNMSPFKKN